MSGIKSGLEEKEVKNKKSFFENRIGCEWPNTKEAAQYSDTVPRAGRAQKSKQRIVIWVAQRGEGVKLEG